MLAGFFCLGPLNSGLSLMKHLGIINWRSLHSDLLSVLAQSLLGLPSRGGGGGGGKGEGGLNLGLVYKGEWCVCIDTVMLLLLFIAHHCTPSL